MSHLSFRTDMLFSRIRRPYVRIGRPQLDMYITVKYGCANPCARQRDGGVWVGGCRVRITLHPRHHQVHAFARSSVILIICITVYDY